MPINAPQKEKLWPVCTSYSQSSPRGIDTNTHKKDNKQYSQWNWTRCQIIWQPMNKTYYGVVAKVRGTASRDRSPTRWTEDLNSVSNGWIYTHLTAERVLCPAVDPYALMLVPLLSSLIQFWGKARKWKKQSICFYRAFENNQIYRSFDPQFATNSLKAWYGHWGKKQRHDEFFFSVAHLMVYSYFWRYYCSSYNVIIYFF